MSTATATCPTANGAPATEVGLPARLADAHTRIRELAGQLDGLAAAHDTLRAGIRDELTVLVARRWVRARDADKILARFGLPPLPRRFVVGARVAVMVGVYAPDHRYAARGARRLILDDLRHLRDARLRASPRQDAYHPGTIAITDVVACDGEAPTTRRPRFVIRASVHLAVTVESDRAATVWATARQRTLADLARLRLVTVNTRRIATSWVHEVGPACLH